MSYTLLDLQVSVADDLNDPSFSPNRITRYLNYGQLAIFNTHMFKFSEKSVSGYLTVGKFSYDQQTDWQSTIGGSVYDPETPSKRFLLENDTYVPHRQFFERYPDPLLEPAGLPTSWTEYANQIYFNCPVDNSYIFNQRYYSVPAPLINSADVPTVPESFRELLELYAEYRAEKYRGNHDVANTYKEEYEAGLESMNVRHAINQVSTPVMRGVTRRVTHD